MANALDLFDGIVPVRLLIVGFPGSGKTGSLAALLNAGFKVRILGFDKKSNFRPLLMFTDRDKLQNLDIVLLEDRLVMEGEQAVPGVSGVPTAYRQGFQLLDNWRYKDARGEKVDLGRSRDWGPDTIVVVDSATAQGEAAMRYARGLSNHNIRNTTDKDFNIAMDLQKTFFERLVGSENGHHVIVLSHLKMISPQVEREGDKEVAAAVKRQIGELIATRYYPSVLGRQLPMYDFGKLFDAVLEARRTYSAAGKERYELNPVSREELDLRLAARDLPSKPFDVSDGLVKVFELLTPGIKECLAAAQSSGDVPEAPRAAQPSKE